MWVVLDLVQMWNIYEKDIFHGEGSQKLLQKIKTSILWGGNKIHVMFVTIFLYIKLPQKYYQSPGKLFTNLKFYYSVKNTILSIKWGLQP